MTDSAFFFGRCGAPLRIARRAYSGSVPECGETIMKRYFLSGFAALGALAGCSSAPTMDTYRPATDLFAPRLDITVGAEPKALAMADMDGDGHLDIVVARATGSGAITLLMGKGDGTFKRVDASNQAGDTPYALAVADS